MIGKTKQDATLNRIGLNRFLANVQRLGCREVQKLITELTHVTRCLTVNADAVAPFDVVPISLGIAPGTHQNEKIGFSHSTEFIITSVFKLLFVTARKHVPRLSQRGDQGYWSNATEVVRGEQHARVTRMRRKSEHPASQISDGAGGRVSCSQIRE